MIVGITVVLAAACFGSFITWLLLRRRPGFSKPRDYSSINHHAKVHTFRLCTMLLAWILLVATFIFYPKYIAQSLRAFSHGVEIRHIGIRYANFVTGAGDGLDVELMQGFAKRIGVSYKLVYSDFYSVSLWLSSLPISTRSPLQDGQQAAAGISVSTMR
ncbi:hypothetical protein ABID58_007437, partial [Bradyrhizobium sp. S3.2.6]